MMSTDCQSENLGRRFAHQQLMPGKNDPATSTHAGAMPKDTHSPRTITLGNAANAIFHSGMVDTQGYGGVANNTLTGGQPAFHQMPSFGVVSDSAGSRSSDDSLPSRDQRPYFPSMKISPASSRPIRITRRKEAYASDHGNTRLVSGQYQQQEGNTEHLSASPGELRHFYDDATWRMYHLIQSSRLEKQESAEAALANSKTGVSSSTAPTAGGDGMDYLRKDDFSFVGRPPRSTLAASLSTNGRQVPIVAPDYDDSRQAGDESEGVFELDDF